MKMLDGKAGIITGGGSGIGREAASLFAKNGAKIVICGRREEPLKETVEIVENEGGEICYFACDVSVETQVKEMVAFAAEKLGGLDFAFNNAGVTSSKEVVGKLIHELPEGFAENMMAINGFGILYCMKYEIPHLLEKGGTIVNTCSNASIYCSRAGTIYAASKHAAWAFTKSAALDYADQNIRVNGIAPGVTITPMIELAMKLNPAKIQALIDIIPDKRAGNAIDQASAAMFLLSDMSSHITGQLLFVDGGQNIKL